MFDKVKSKVNNFLEKKESELELEIKKLIELRDQYEPGSKEWKAIDERLPEYFKAQNEAVDIQTRKKLKRIEVGSGIVLSGLGLLLYKVYLDKGIEFEKEGTFRSATVRNLINKIRPGK